MSHTPRNSKKARKTNDAKTALVHSPFYDGDKIRLALMPDGRLYAGIRGFDRESQRPGFISNRLSRQNAQDLIRHLQAAAKQMPSDGASSLEA